MAYLSDLGVNAIEVMPLSNVAASVDWGYLPVGTLASTKDLGSDPPSSKWWTSPTNTASP